MQILFKKNLSSVLHFITYFMIWFSFEQDKIKKWGNARIMWHEGSFAKTFIFEFHNKGWRKIICRDEMFNGPVLRLKANLLSPPDYSLDFGAFFWNSCSFMANPMLPCTFSLPWKNAFCEFSFPVIRSTRSPSDMVSVTSGLAARNNIQYSIWYFDFSHPCHWTQRSQARSWHRRSRNPPCCPDLPSPWTHKSLSPCRPGSCHLPQETLRSRQRFPWTWIHPPMLLKA